MDVVVVESVAFASALAVFGGVNNGYNMVVVAEILTNMRTDKILNTAVQEGIFVASINVGIVLMLPLGAYLADKYGRLRTVIVGEIIVVVASLLQMFCFTALSLTLSRTCVGFGMALCVLLKPLYIAELVRRADERLPPTVNNGMCCILQGPRGAFRTCYFLLYSYLVLD